MFVQKSFEERETGTLYLVGTPIGNLEDMTFRAVRILKEANWIAAEDTRQTRKLLSHFEIAAVRVVSYHEHNKKASGPELIRKLQQGESVALVSDAGLPAISDPGADLVQLALQEGIAVVPIPGANAALSALIASGLATDRFSFVGFLPRDNKGLRRELERLASKSETLLLYESPHRVEKTLKAILEACGDRSTVLARELTKRYEEFARGTISECLAFLNEHPPLGEYCILLQGKETAGVVQPDAAWWNGLSVTEHVDGLMAQDETLSKKEAMKRAAEERGMAKRDIYSLLIAEKSPGQG